MAKNDGVGNEGGGWSGFSSLLYADASDPDMRYLSQFSAFDPYLALTANGRKVAVAPHHEYGRMRSESAFDEVLCLPDIEEEVSRRLQLAEGRKPSKSQIIRHLSDIYEIKEFIVGSRFPAGLYDEMQKAGLKVRIENNGGLFPERLCKSAEEIKAIRRANRASTAGFRLVAQTLADSEIRKGILYHEGRVLTSERLRDKIQHACLDAGASAFHTIAAVGDQVCDNHCLGHGPIRAGEFIVVDIFPQRHEDGYWGDMTRTFLKGRATDAQRHLMKTVRKAHRLALGMIKPGVRLGRVHEAVEQFFAEEGYESNSAQPEPRGFYHALGHGVGLEIHEEPVMRKSSTIKFCEGMVMAVEPGLYYKGLGGVRIEDVVHLIPGGNKKISSSSYAWEIR